MIIYSDEESGFKIEYVTSRTFFSVRYSIFRADGAWCGDYSSEDEARFALPYIIKNDVDFQFEKVVLGGK
jgi:hypothetical protein